VNSRAGILIARQVDADNIRTGILIASQVEGNVEAVIDTQRAILIGLVTGLVFGTLALLASIFRRRG
jgi:hypothetical protein